MQLMLLSLLMSSCCGALSDTDPQTLQYTLWWLIATHMGTRGRDEHHKLRFGDFTVKSTTDGHEYVEFSAEQGTKTRSGETEKSTNANARSSKLKCGLHQIHQLDALFACAEHLLKCVQQII